MKKENIEKVAFPIIGLLIVIGVWQLIYLRVGHFMLPSPLSISQDFIKVIYQSKKIAAQGGGNYGISTHLLYTGLVTVIGSIIGIILGVLFGILLGLVKKLRRFSRLVIEAVRTIPPLAIVPFFILWFGPNLTSQLTMIIFYCGVMLLVNTTEAIKNLNPIYSQFAYTLGAKKSYVYRTVVLPGIIPEIIGGVRVVIGFSWGIQIVAELMGSPKGMGQVFLKMVSMQALDVIIPGIIWITLIAYFFDFLFIRLSNFIIRWSPTIIK